MTLHLPITFTSPSHPSHKIQYIHLNAARTNHTLIFCFGAGGRSIDLNLYQSFLSTHAPSLSLLSVDRWTQGSDASRTGPDLLSELSFITLELLDSLNIETISVAAHSAGAYQMLDLIARCSPGKVKIGHIFPICTHIPAPFTASKVMTSMCTMPSILFDGITKLDSCLADSLAEKAFLKIVGTGKTDRDEEATFVDSKDLRDMVSEYKPDDAQLAMMKEFSELDYRLGYTRIPGIGLEELTAFYTDCAAVALRFTWFTCEADVFFGPASVERIAKEMKGVKVEMVVVKEASHSDIFMRREVWQSMYERISNQ